MKKKSKTGRVNNGRPMKQRAAPHPVSANISLSRELQRITIPI